VPTPLFPIGKILRESSATWRGAGTWPCNEGFIQRMKGKHAQKL
jgi:hypothetical protein